MLNYKLILYNYIINRLINEQILKGTTNKQTLNKNFTIVAPQLSPRTLIIFL
jgi:hypothetical protein